MWNDDRAANHVFYTSIYFFLTLFQLFASRRYSVALACALDSPSLYIFLLEYDRVARRLVPFIHFAFPLCETRICVAHHLHAAPKSTALAVAHDPELFSRLHNNNVFFFFTAHSSYVERESRQKILAHFPSFNSLPKHKKKSLNSFPPFFCPDSEFYSRSWRWRVYRSTRNPRYPS